MAGLQFWKIKCFRLHLNESRQCFCQRGRGRSFHVDEPKTEKARNQQWRVWCEESGGWEYQKKSREYGRVCKAEDGHRDKTEQCPRYIYESKSYRIHSSHLKVHIRRLQHGFKLSFSCLRTLVERLVSRWALSASQRQLYKCSQKTDQLVLAHDQEINLAVWREKKKGYENQTKTSDSEKTDRLVVAHNQEINLAVGKKRLRKPDPNSWFWELSFTLSYLNSWDSSSKSHDVLQVDRKKSLCLWRHMPSWGQLKC